jgi:hypothetical protein
MQRHQQFLPLFERILEEMDTCGCATRGDDRTVTIVDFSLRIPLCFPDFPMTDPFVDSFNGWPSTWRPPCSSHGLSAGTDLQDPMPI